MLLGGQAASHPPLRNPKSQRFEFPKPLKCTDITQLEKRHMRWRRLSWRAAGEGYPWGGHSGLGHSGLGIIKVMMQGFLPIPSCSRLYLLLADPPWSRQGAMEGRWSTSAAACWTRSCEGACGKIRKAYQIFCSSETA